ncbi:glycerol-3-phosphate dehydrogenase [Sphingomonas sp. PvP055]
MRPLYDDGASEAKAVTRDYVLELDTNGPVLLSIFGGKITTARHLAEEALGKLAAPMGFVAHPVTRTRVFPGGAITDFRHFVDQVRATWPFLGETRSERMAHAYGSMLPDMLKNVTAVDDLGADLGGGVTEVEARWLRTREWARSADDVLLRRSKIGLHLSETERAAFVSAWDALA